MSEPPRRGASRPDAPEGEVKLPPAEERRRTALRRIENVAFEACFKDVSIDDAVEAVRFAYIKAGEMKEASA